MPSNSNQAASTEEVSQGALPAFETPLHVGSPNTGNMDTFLSLVREIFERNWFTNNGACVRELEAKIADYLQVKHCILTANATLALDICGRALGLKGEVIVPSFTFVATAHSLLWQNVKPVFCDVDIHSHNIDPLKIEALIGPETSGILAVHVWGRPAAIDRLQELAEQYSLKLIFDAAHAFGCSHQGKMIANFGNAEVLSFHATKFFNTFEGGAITTNDDLLAQKLQKMRNFGFAGIDQVVSLGTNAKMTEVSAAMGLTSFEAIESFIYQNYLNYRTYKALLSSLSGYELLEYNENEKNNFQYIIVTIDPELAGHTRDEVVSFLHSHGVLARKYFYPGCHRMEPYRSMNIRTSGLEITERLSERVMALPTGMSIREKDIHAIFELLRVYQEQQGRLL